MNEQLQKILDHPVTIPASVGVVAFLGGLGLGHILWNRKKGQLHVLPESVGLEHMGDVDIPTPGPVEIREEDYEEIKGSKPHGVLVDEIQDIHLENVTLADSSDEEEEDEPIDYNVFAADSETWNYEEELANRTEEAPYIIHHDEFHSNEKEYVQGTLRYYRGDNFLVDEDDAPIYNYDQILGPLRFGHGSNGDPNLVFIRNDKTKTEYEIIAEDGMFAVEVMGMEIEDAENSRSMRHSKHPDGWVRGE